MNLSLHRYTVQIICDMRIRTPEEVELLLDEASDSYDLDIASEYAIIHSRLLDFLAATRGGEP